MDRAHGRISDWSSSEDAWDELRDPPAMDESAVRGARRRRGQGQRRGRGYLRRHDVQKQLLRGDTGSSTEEDGGTEQEQIVRERREQEIPGGRHIR